MILPTIASLTTDPNVAVALVSDTLKSNVNAHFVESPSLDYTNIPTRLTCLFPTPDSLRNLLDALVTVSASTSPDGNETIACALRLDSDHSTRPAVEFILSSHEPIRGGTVRHFQEIWRQMLVISKLPHKRGADRESFIHLLTTFRHTMYAYTLRKLRVEFARHMAIIDMWRTQNTAASGHLVADLRSGDDAHFRMPLVEALFHLDRCRSAFASMREDDQEPKRLISTAHDFMTLVAALELAKDAVDKLLLHIVSLRVLSTRCFQCKYVLGNAFESITSLPRHIVNLLHFAANNMDSLHSHNLVLTLVSPLKAIIKAPCPRTKKSWKAIREHILTEKGAWA
ncbi:hypothetical protein HYPSUDRAFT_66374 [Hypholoma sublateritium FD-334 SS-4]|uniref:Uncharacterized protein n=1 Tax=Hypholoma sublateritium (strain FD-334 SS-4) TaxID=945553 RepID=A0A0D2P439_HYPSF|nr:hypothetical protein HYPSUDRAFT_66374 [Hypholoma sublateritium FD-334 SS-4]